MTRHGVASLMLVAAAALTAEAAVMRAVVRRRRAAGPRRVSCACGQEYEVAGANGRRDFRPADAPETQLMRGDTCPVCQASLPDGGARTVTHREKIS